MRAHIIIASLALCSLTAFAQESQAPKLSLKPTGRILMDGAGYIGGNNDIDGTDDKKFVSGVAIPDLRLGLKASYGNWKAKIDVGFAYGKVGLKDVYVEYDFNKANLLRGGYFVPQWGLNSETSSAMKPSYEEPSSNEFFYANPRLLALMHVYDKGAFFTGTSVYAEAAAMTNNATALGSREAWGAQTRLVWRPFHQDGKVVQIGTSFNYSSPTANDHKGFAFSANFPSRVSKVNLLSANIDGAKGLFKMTPELLLVHRRIALESQYYYMDVARRNGLGNYRAHGVYAMFRGMLIGKTYRYTHADAGVATPDPKSLEVVVDYNFTNASDRSAGIWGGKTNDISCTFNYYINKYMIARLRYSYTNVTNRHVSGLSPSRDVNIVEARFQVAF